MTAQPPIDRPAPLPAFNGDGNLPPGDYWPSAADFEARFVTVAGSSTRRAIYDGFTRHRGEIRRDGVADTAPCLLNGSFTTSKTDPNDIDLVVEVDANTFLASARLHRLLGGPVATPDYLCDAYPLLVFAPTHPSYQTVTDAGRDYWRKWFGTDRGGNRKGLVWSKVQGF